MPLIASEITGLWKSYMIATTVGTITKYYLNHVENEEIRSILQQSLDLSNEHIQDLTNFFNEEELTIQDRVNGSDININNFKSWNSFNKFYKYNLMIMHIINKFI
nr:DUF3231 family protein [Clostridium sp.]